MCIRDSPRRPSLAKKEELSRLLQDMLISRAVGQEGLIEPLSSPWSSPVVLLTKKGNGLHFCIEYWKLNNATKKYCYPLLHVYNTLDILSGAQWFSLGLKSGNWQVRFHQEDKGKIAFLTPRGLFQFKVMPFGLCNVLKTATIVRLMDLVLRGLTLSLIHICWVS